MNTNIAAGHNSPSLSTRLARRVSRRSLVGAWAVCCLAFIALAVLEVNGVAWFVLIALTLAADTMLYIATHRITDRPTASLDEREQTVRNRAYRSAYVLVFYGTLVAIGGALLLFYTGILLLPRWLAHPEAHPAVLTGFGVATLQLVAMLPTALVAWVERDAPSDLN